MKKIFFSCMLSVSLFMILVIPVNAQDKTQKKMHMVIEENGKLITDTSVIFDKGVSEEDIQAAISVITREKGHPCHAHNQPAMHRDTLVYKCRHMQKSELDTLLEVSGKTFAFIPADSCRHPHGPCPKHTEKVGAGKESSKHMEKEIIWMGNTSGKEFVVIEENGDIIIRKGHIPGEKCIRVIVESDGDTVVRGKTKEIMILETSDEGMDLPEGCEKKTVEKKVIITEEGNKTEKIIIQESPADAEKKVIEKKVIITKEGDKAEKTIILESPDETEKKVKKDN